MITYKLSRDGPFCFRGRTYHKGDTICPQTLPKALTKWESLGWIEPVSEAPSAPLEPHLSELPEGHKAIKDALKGSYRDRLALVGDLDALQELPDRKDATLTDYLTHRLLGGS